MVTKAPPKKNSRQKKRAKEKLSQRQKDHNESMSEAAAYWRGRGKKTPIYAELAAATIMRTAYNFAISDWFHLPEIHRIEQKEGYIRVEATDNVMVARVQVTILDEEGKVLETGDAVKGEGDG